MPRYSLSLMPCMFSDSHLISAGGQWAQAVELAPLEGRPCCGPVMEAPLPRHAGRLSSLAAASGMPAKPCSCLMHSAWYGLAEPSISFRGGAGVLPIGRLVGAIRSYSTMYAVHCDRGL
jgi:hypothetical protein